MPWFTTGIRVSVGLVLLVAALSMAGAGCGEDGGPRPPVPAADGKSDAYGELPVEVAGYRVSRGAAAGYVPDRSCRDCHESLYDGYQAVGMARSFYPLTKATAVEDFGRTFVHQATGYRYEMVERGGKYYQRRYCLDDDGQRFALYEAEVSWVIGSGNHARTYLTQTAFGELFELPMSWYRGVGWQMSPGFGMAGHDRFERQVPRGCMFCHNAYPEVPLGSDLPGKPHLFPADLPHGIGCQRCHGPGARHVEAAIGDAADAEVRQRIVNPARLAPERRQEVCMTCHMQPDVSSGGDSTSRAFDRAVYAHRPDQSILDYLVYFDFGAAGDRAAKIEVNHHDHRMRQSRCYTDSDGKLGCLSCHDPHRKVAAGDSVAFYRGKCFECHAVADCRMEGMGTTLDPAQADCALCHMPRVRPRDVVQVTITDHKIQRRPPDRQRLTAQRAESDMPQGRLEVVPSFPSRGPRGPWLEIHTGLAKALRLQRDEVPALRAALRAAAPRSPDAYLRVGRAIGDIAEHAAAAAVLREGLAQFPGDFGLRWNLAMMLHHLGENDAAQQHLDAALKVDVDPQALALQGNLFVVGKQLERASAAFARALELRPMSSTTWRRQARVLVSLGRLEEAAQAFRRAIAGDPEAAEAYRRLAQVHLRLGQTARALQVLRQGASRSMGNRLDLVVQRAVGDARLRDAEDAIRQATAATRREPGDGRTHLHLAFALQLAGRSNGVAEHLARARHLGADRACCAGLELLQALEGGAKDRVREFLTVFERELNTPTREPLRATIAAILRQRLGR